MLTQLHSAHTDISTGDWLTFTSSLDELDCIWAFENHLAVNCQVPLSAPLFAFYDANNPASFSTLSRSDLMDRCNSIWKSAGLSCTSGHSFRIGGTTHLLIHGVDPWVIMKQGRWSSKAFLLYWRNIEDIIPLLIGDSLDKFSSIKSSIARIQKL